MTERVTLVVDLEYFAPAIFYLELTKWKYCIFEQYDNYQKMTFRNRCVVVGAEGLINLTVPLQGGRDQRKLMKDVMIDNSEKWQLNHLKTLTSIYRKSPFFEFYETELQTLFSTRFDFLIDWNVACFRWICDKMSLDVEWNLSREFVKTYPADCYVDWRDRLKPSTINREFPASHKYTQVFEERIGFVPNLSILDYLFCAGNRIVRGEMRGER